MNNDLDEIEEIRKRVTAALPWAHVDKTAKSLTEAINKMCADYGRMQNALIWITRTAKRTAQSSTADPNWFCEVAEEVAQKALDSVLGVGNEKDR
jgi:L-lactate utilization protein LutC